MNKKTISAIGATALMLVAYTLFTASAIAAGAEAETSEGSPLYQRLKQNRMPAGINPSETRDHPNLRLLERWIAQEAKCD